MPFAPGSGPPIGRGCEQHFGEGRVVTYRGLIWVSGDDISTAVEATVTIDDHRVLSIVSKGDNLGSWPLDQVGVEPRGDSDFLLTVESDQIMFRPGTPAGHMSFGGATTRPSGLSGRIRSASTGSPVPPPPPPTHEPSGSPVAATSHRAPDSYQPPGKKKSPSKVGRNLLIAVVVLLGIGYLASRGSV